MNDFGDELCPTCGAYWECEHKLEAGASIILDGNPVKDDDVYEFEVSPEQINAEIDAAIYGDPTMRIEVREPTPEERERAARIKRVLRDLLPGARPPE